MLPPLRIHGDRDIAAVKNPFRAPRLEGGGSRKGQKGRTSSVTVGGGYGEGLAVGEGREGQGGCGGRGGPTGGG